MRYAIATGLRLIREAEGLKQSELADRLTVSQAAISRRETYRDTLSIDSLEDYAKAFAVDVPTLLERLAESIRAAEKGGRSST